jgi:hypothetical protein
LSSDEDDLPPQALEDFYAAVCEVYDEGSFRRLLLFRCEGHGLKAMGEKTAFTENVWWVFEKSVQEGWLRTLFIPAVLADRSDSENIRRWVRKYHSHSQWSATRSSGPGRPRAQDPLSALHFDMKAIKASIRNSLAGSSLGVFGFGLKNGELWFTEMVRDLFVDRLAAQYKKPLTLNPMISEVSRQVREVEMYRRTLEQDSVLCVVDVYGASKECVSDFWERVTGTFGDIGRYFILLFVGSDSTEFPTGITELPPPTFDHDDVADWTEATVRQIQWPGDLADRWRSLLVDYSYHDGQFNARMFYEELDRTIKDVHFDRDKFRLELESKVNS